METIQQKNRIILLWPDGAPTSNGLAGVELEDAPNAISNIEPFPIGLSGDEAEWQGDLDVSGWRTFQDFDRT